MPTLRDHVRETFAAREPNEHEARADLHAILVRAEGRRRRRAWPFVVVPVAALGVIVAL